MRSFSFGDLSDATRDFRPASVAWGDGVGSVFKGWIDENTLAAAKPGTGLAIAVKKLDQETLHSHREWLEEVNYLGQFSHPHLVKLIGYCLEEDRRLLVYEFLSRGSLDNHLFLRGWYFQSLSWCLRLKVALGAAKGLDFLHSDAARVVYGDFKTSNILLDSNYNAKLSDFGLAKDGPTGDRSLLSTRVVGSYGYAAPEYIATGYSTAKSNVYSYGVVLLEMLSGRRAVDKNRPNNEHMLVEWARPYLANKRKLVRVMDNRLEGQYTTDSAQRLASLALRCVSLEPRLRPAMSQAVQELEQLQDLNSTEMYHSKTRNKSMARARSNSESGDKNSSNVHLQPASSLPLNSAT